MAAKRLGIGAMGLMLVLGEQFVSAASVTLTPVADTSISESTQGPPTDGASAAFVAGGLGNNESGRKVRALLRFDLGEIPTNASVVEVSLLVHVIKTPGEAVAASEFELRRVLVEWSETDAHWGGPTAVENWNSPGGEVGIDYSFTISSTIPVSDGGVIAPVPYTFSSTANLVADVQHWLENPGENFGWLMKTASEEVRFTARHFASRENSPSIQPQLTVVYSEEPSVEEPLVENLRRSGDQLLFDFAAAADTTYRVEFKESLSVTNWQTLTNVAGVPAAGTAVISDTISGTQRYYRVIVP